MPKQLSFSLLALLGAVLLLEAGARAWEAALPVAARSLPTPEPNPDPALVARVQSLAAARGGGVPLARDEERGWSLTPGIRLVNRFGVVTRVNSLGMRGPPPTARAAGEERLLSLGDSSVFGVNVAESQVFTSVAARELGRALGRPVSAMIGAVPGHDSWMALQTLRKHGAAAQPTWVVIGTLWSDVVYRRGPHMRFSALQEGALALRGALDRLALYRVVRRGLQPLLSSERVRWAASDADIGPDPRGNLSRVPLAAYIGNLRALVRQASALGARAVLVVLPAPMDFDGAAPLATVQVYREAMRAAARQTGAVLLDGPRYFLSHGGSAALFLDHVHPGPEGHALLGRALAEAILAARARPGAAGPGEGN